MTDPIDKIEWRVASDLNSNNYNPNVVFNKELKLLELSILKQGWIQPVLILEDGTIIDGFHRAKLAQDSKEIKEKYKGKCPCVVLELDRPQAMMLTIRINRAKGSHVAFKMSSIIQELIDKHNFDPMEIAKEIGANRDEIDLLYKKGVFEAKDIKNYKYSKAWYPIETTRK